MSNFYERSRTTRALGWLPVTLLCAIFCQGCGSDGSGTSGAAAPAGKRESAGTPDSAYGANGDSNGDSISPATADRATNSTGKRVVGYIQTFRLHDAPELDFSTLTHLNLAFANVVKDGSVDFPDTDRGVIAGVVSRAKRSGVKVLGALAGGDADQAKALTDALNADVSGFVDKVLKFVDTYDLDGIDVDIEGDQIDVDKYPKLMDSLAQRLPSGKILSAAVANYRSERYGSLDKADFLNVMSYDNCAAWSGPCEQSTVAAAQNDLAHWATITSPDKVVLGLPFYGVCWGDGCDPNTCQANPKFCKENVFKFSYQSILESSFASPAVCQPDVLQGSNYYISLNGPETLASKVALTKNYGGVMVWELGQDTPDAKLFSVVRDALQGVSPRCEN